MRIPQSMRDPQPARDWSTLRNREWKPTLQPQEGGGGSSSSGASGSRAAPKASQNGTTLEPDASHQKNGSRSGYPVQSQRFCTDTEISGCRLRGGEEKVLQRWQADDTSSLHGTLEELCKPSRSSLPKYKQGGWDQFTANSELFGVTSTFKHDLSQYSTKLDMASVPDEVKQKAMSIALEIEGKSGSKDAGRLKKRADDMDLGAEYEEEEEAEGDEEDLFSAVPRPHQSQAEAWLNGGSEDGGIGGALLASLRSGPAKSEGSGKPGGGYRSLVAPKVHSWWRARRLSGVSIPEGAEDAFVCPFSERVFGDVSQLVMHWAAALPAAAGADQKATTPSTVASEQFQQTGANLLWQEMAAEYELDGALPLEAPKTGSVWAQILSKLEARGKAASKNGERPHADLLVADVLAEVVKMKCWQRDAKVEHREVCESIATALALHVLEGRNGVAWSPDREKGGA